MKISVNKKERQVIKGFAFLLLILFSLVFTLNHHLGYSLADSCLIKLGIPTWSNEYEPGINIHYTMFIGLPLFLIGYKYSRFYLNNVYPSFMRRLIFIVIAFIFVYPTVTDKMMYLIKFNSSGLDAITYYQKKSKCTFHSNPETLGSMSCNLTLVNYSGKSMVISVIPNIAKTNYWKDMKESFEGIELEPVSIQLSPRSKLNMGIYFKFKQISQFNGSGSIENVALDIEFN
ncbi:hypothetical protein BC351_17785 [Paenibacillus ferrarius]|uniref:Uncharacterized protein n=1 Tax=Paenibacillus ferrarius TaxID=1469647 RepID=A0A1V4HQ99_9BACL|nr:hypothetical protein [Paenibacillus ferrarius]OPH60349.1 hypothetical protein BC351_17785 [Paenibacillus ferrarius]